jgi:hypothetical protein
MTCKWSEIEKVTHSACGRRFREFFDWRAQSAQVVKRRPVASARAESVLQRPQKIAVLVRVSNVAIGWTIYRGILAHSQEAFFAV